MIFEKQNTKFELEKGFISYQNSQFRVKNFVYQILWKNFETNRKYLFSVFCTDFNLEASWDTCLFVSCPDAWAVHEFRLYCIKWLMELNLEHELKWWLRDEETGQDWTNLRTLDFVTSREHSDREFKPTDKTHTIKNTENRLQRHKKLKWSKYPRDVDHVSSGRKFLRVKKNFFKN